MGAATEQLKKFAAGLLRIQPGEERKTTLMFGIMLCVVGSFIIGRVARDSLFLSRYSVDYLPYLYIWVALGASVQSYLYSRVADRFRRNRTLAVTLVTVLLVTLAARLSLYWVGDWFYPVLYVFVELAGTLLVIQVWTLANDVFTTREAKRLFGLVGAGGVVSAVVVGFSVRGLVRLIGTEDLLFLSALTLGVGLLLVNRLSRSAQEELIPGATEGRGYGRARISLFADWARIFANRQLVFVTGLMVMLALVITFVDYQFKITARSAYLNQEEQLAGFFGLFWAITGVINCLIQFFLTGRILEQAGILFSLLLLPLSLFSGAATLIIHPALWSATLLKGGDAVLRYTINDATMQLLYLPVPAQFRGRAKAFIDGIVRPLSIGLSGVALVWIVPTLVPGAMGWLLLGLLVVWIGFAFGVRRQYFESLIRTLRTRRLHFGEVNGIIPDEAASRVLRNALADSDEENLLHVLDMIRHYTTMDWSEDLVRLSAHSSPTVRARVLRLLGERGSLRETRLVFDRLRDPSPEVRAAAVEAYCAVGKERAVRAITRFLNDPEASVREAAVVGLIRYGGLDGVLSSAERLKGMLESEAPTERAAGARILGNIGVKNFYHPLLSLLTDPELEVRIAAIRSAGKMQSIELLPALVYRIEEPATRGVASEALSAFGSPAVRILQRVLANPDEQLSTRSAIPPILARIAEQPAIDALLIHIEDPNEVLRTRVLESIHRAVLRKSNLKISREMVRRAAQMEIGNLYQEWFVHWDLNLPSDDHLLAEALGDRRGQALRRIFLLLGCFLPVRTVDAVYQGLQALTRRSRANAIEVLDNLLDKEMKRLLLPLLDDALEEQREAAGRELFGLKHQDWYQRLSAIMDKENAWLSSCAVFTAGQARDIRLRRDVLACTTSDSPLVRETALVALSRMISPEELRPTVTRHLRDPAVNVREVASWLLKQNQTSS